MKKEKLEELDESLAEFVIRVCKGKATPEETEAMPEVARLLLRY
jgi:hypothetical protein